MGMAIYPFVCQIFKTGAQESVTVTFPFMSSAVCPCVSYTPGSTAIFTGLLIDFRCSRVRGGVRDDCGGGEGLAVWRTRHLFLQSKENESYEIVI